MTSCWRCTARPRPRVMGEELVRIVAIDDLYAAPPDASYR